MEEIKEEEKKEDDTPLNGYNPPTKSWFWKLTGSKGIKDVKLNGVDLNEFAFVLSKHYENVMASDTDNPYKDKLMEYWNPDIGMSKSTWK